MIDKKFKVSINGYELDLEETNEGIKLEDLLFQPKIEFSGKNYLVTINDLEFKVEYRDEGLFLNGKEVDFHFRSSPQIMTKKTFSTSRGAEVKAAIPGKIVEIRVKNGQEIKDQQCLLILESMKMRNEILAPVAGVIETILVNEGDQVNARQLLLKIKPKQMEPDEKKER